MKKSTFKILMYLNLVFILLAIVGNIYGYYLTKNYQFILNIMAIIFSLVYLFYAYKKHAAAFFKGFMLFLALKEVLAIRSMLVEEAAPIYAVAIIALMMIGFVSYALIKDLGKKISFVTGFVILILALVTLIYGMLYTPSIVGENILSGITLNIFNLTRVLM